jgi:hypothetical protein
MELSLPWEEDSWAATQQFLRISRSPKAHYRVHKSPPLVPILSQINPPHTTPSYLSTINFTFIIHLYLGFPSDLFPSGFPTKILYAFLFLFIRATCPTHLIDLILFTWTRVEVMTLLIMQFSSVSRHFISTYSVHTHWICLLSTWKMYFCKGQLCSADWNTCTAFTASWRSTAQLVLTTMTSKEAFGCLFYDVRNSECTCSNGWYDG